MEDHAARANAPPLSDITKMFLHRNKKMKALVQNVLLKTLLHAIKRGSIEGIRVAIERGVSIHYVDQKKRNLIMLAVKCDTDVRLQSTVILADAGCDINQSDIFGYTCLHYACACGAMDVVCELLRRGVHVTFNPFGYGPERFIVPKVIKANSLLQHTEQMMHEDNVRACWSLFSREASKLGYAIHCDAHCIYGKPLKVSFRAPESHSPFDRLRVIDLNSDVPFWLQNSETMCIPPGTIGTITLDAECLSQKSEYRILYEAYRIYGEIESDTKSQIMNLDTGASHSMDEMNDLVIEQLEMQHPLSTNHIDAHTIRNAMREERRDRAISAAVCRNVHTSKIEGDIVDVIDIDSSQIYTSPAAFHPDINSVVGDFKIMAMSSVQISHSIHSQINEYEIIARNKGPLGLHLEPVTDRFSRSTKLVVRNTSGQAAAVSIGDYLIGINSANIEHAGVKYTTWQLNESLRPLILRFRRGNHERKTSLLPQFRSLRLSTSSTIIV